MILEVFRPIALLSPSDKVIERLMLKDFFNFLLAEHQHGFRAEQLSTTAVNITNIKLGLNKHKPCDHTLSVSVELTTAFDTIEHSVLLNDV